MLAAALVACCAAAYTASTQLPTVAASHTPVPAPSTFAPPPPAPAPVHTAQRGSATIPAVVIHPEPHPLAHLSTRELQELLRMNPERLGSASIGRPNRGRLLNGVLLTDSPGIRVVERASSYGTEATVRSIQSAVATVLEAYPDTRPLFVGDLSRRGGGYLRPHRSHQTGLDVDLGYYYLGDERWYTRANRDNLDRERTWALVKALVSQGNVEYIFMDRSIQELLAEHALERGEPADFVWSLFQSPKNRSTIVRHVRRHLTHFHVRFRDPIAEETGRRLLTSWRRLPRL